MLVNDMREKASKQINLVDIDPEIFKALLMYIYGGVITNFHDHDKTSKILKAADQYGLLWLNELYRSFADSSDSIPTPFTVVYLSP